MRAHGSSTLALLVVLALGLGGCERIVIWWITPDPFDSQQPPPAPDYADPQSWAALPDRDDWADRVPPGSGAVDRQGEARVDVFFVHPTTYYKSAHFNGPIDDEDTNRITDEGVMAIQASAFNGAARIYAPRYRQIALGGYFTEDREKGLALAYGDVLRAFDHYLAHWNAGRPLYLAAHSQGTRHSLQLLGDRFARASPVRERLIAAYLIGGWLPEHRFTGNEADLPACERADDTGCVIGWRTVAEDGTPSLRDGLAPGETNLCTNPLLWTRGPERAPRERNLGSLPLNVIRDGELPPIDRALVGARCADGWLRIDRPDADGYGVLVRRGDYHTYDYALFYMNLRENARRRVEAYLAAQR